MKDLLTLNNIKFLLNGLLLTLYISVVSIIISTIFGTLLGVLRNSKKGILKALATTYIEIIRNIPNLLWIYVVFILFKVKSVEAGLLSFTIFTSAAIGEIVRGGLNSVPKGQYEAAKSQGFNKLQALCYIILPQAFKSIMPALISQFVTVIKDTCFLWSVVALQELTGKVTILMGRYYQVNQVFMLYGILAMVYFVVNFSISYTARRLKKIL
jgi:putative glutamine transport system permease protein